jgi:hypothetical protein
LSIALGNSKRDRDALDGKIHAESGRKADSIFVGTREQFGQVVELRADEVHGTISARGPRTAMGLFSPKADQPVNGLGE